MIGAILSALLTALMQNEYRLESLQGPDATYESLDNYGEFTRFRKLSAPVGRLDIIRDKKISTCTASIISREYILTNFHCISNIKTEKPITQAWIVMDYYDATQLADAPKYQVDPEPIETDEKLDYAILKVEGNPSARFGTVSLSKQETPSKASLLIIHHPEGQPKHITRQQCLSSEKSVTDKNVLLHTCDTFPGSSGAPIFDDASGEVVAIHYGGFGDADFEKLNRAKKMSSLLENSATLTKIADETPTNKPISSRLNPISALQPGMKRAELKQLEDQPMVIDNIPFPKSNFHFKYFDDGGEIKVESITFSKTENAITPVPIFSSEDKNTTMERCLDIETEIRTITYNPNLKFKGIFGNISLRVPQTMQFDWAKSVERKSRSNEVAFGYSEDKINDNIGSIYLSNISDNGTHLSFIYKVQTKKQGFFGKVWKCEVAWSYGYYTPPVR